MSSIKCPVCGKEVSPFTRIHCGRPLPITQYEPENPQAEKQADIENEAPTSWRGRLDYALIQLRTSPEKKYKIIRVCTILIVILVIVSAVCLDMSSRSPYKCVVCNKGLTDANVYSYNGQDYCFLCRQQKGDGANIEPRCGQCGETARYHNEDYTDCYCEDCWNLLVENGKIVPVGK